MVSWHAVVGPIPTWGAIVSYIFILVLLSLAREGIELCFFYDGYGKRAGNRQMNFISNNSCSSTALL